MKVSMVMMIKVTLVLALLMHGEEIMVRGQVYRANDLSTFQWLYDLAGGQNWRQCSEYRNDPCACTERIGCVEYYGELYISKLDMSDNNLVGELSLKKLDLLYRVNFGQNPNLSVSQDSSPWIKDGVRCLDFDCSGLAECIFPSHLPSCAEGTDLALWRQLYDQLNGKNWARCSENRDDPCKCDYVVCEYDLNLRTPLHILEIILPDNNMTGELVDLDEMPRLRQLNIGGSSNSFSNPTRTDQYDCVDILQRCHQDIVCDLANLNVLLCAFNDLGAWRYFYDSLHKDDGGATPWRICEGDRNHPCRCTKKLECSGGRILGIKLYQNDLHGELPTKAIATFRSLNYIWLNNTNLDSPTLNNITLSQQDIDRGCVNIPRCYDQSMECHLFVQGIRFCAPGEVEEPVVASPPDHPVALSDLYAWQELFDRAGGLSWLKCSNLRDRPCDCYFNKDPRRRVVCQNNRIVAITLQNNRVYIEDDAQGSVVAHHMRTLPELGFMDFSNPIKGDKNYFNMECFSFPECQFFLTCALPPQTEFCHQTIGPTVSPTPLPTFSPTQRPTLTLKDLGAWRALYDATDGPNWSYCSEFRDYPCDCSVGPNRKVVCQGDYITEIVLRNNNLNGVTLPTSKLMQMENLERLQLDNSLSATSGLNVFSGYNEDLCIDLPRCESGLTACSAPDDVLYCFQTSPPTTPQTLAPTMSQQILEEDLLVWQQLYQATDGANWVLQCSMDDPCSCTNNYDKFVTCKNGRIAEIVLPNNRMKGVFPASSVHSLVALERLIVSNAGVVSSDANDFTNTGCINFPKCTQLFTVLCDVSNTDLVFCALDIPTRKPTTRPSAMPTRSPVTNEPTMSPVTNSPSKSPTPMPTYSPTRSIGRSIFMSLRFVRASYESTGGDKFKVNMTNILAKTFAVASDSVLIHTYRSGSIIVEFELANYTLSMPTGTEIMSLLNDKTSANEKAILFPGLGTWYSMEDLVQILHENPTTGTTTSPTSLPTQAPVSTRPTSSPTTPPMLIENAAQIVGGVFGGVFLLAILFYFAYKNRPMSQRELDRKSSWRMDGIQEIPALETARPFQKDSTLSSQPPLLTQQEFQLKEVTSF